MLRRLFASEPENVRLARAIRRGQELSARVRWERHNLLNLVLLAENLLPIDEDKNWWVDDVVVADRTGFPPILLLTV